MIGRVGPAAGVDLEGKRGAVEGVDGHADCRDRRQRPPGDLPGRSTDRAAGHQVFAWSGTTPGSRGGIALRPVDLTDEAGVARSLAETDPEAVIHAAALSSADAVYRDPRVGRAVNVEVTRRLAAWAASHDRRILFTSTDLVFDGAGSWYREEDEAVPILEYGRTKLEAESFVLAIPRGLVARLSLLFGPALGGNPGFYDLALAALARGEPRAFFRDEFRTPWIILRRLISLRG